MMIIIIIFIIVMIIKVMIHYIIIFIITIPIRVNIINIIMSLQGGPLLVIHVGIAPPIKWLNINGVTGVMSLSPYF